MKHLFIEIVGQDIEPILGNWFDSPNYKKSGEDAVLSARPGVLYKIVNRGKTPAIIREVSQEIDHQTVLMPEPRYFPQAIGFNPIIEAEGKTTDIECNLPRWLTTGEADAIFSGRSSIWFIGRVIFDDVLGGKGRELRFLWRYTGDGKGFRPDYQKAYNKRT